MFKNTMKTGVLLASLGGLIVAVATLLGGRGGATIGLVLAFVMVGGSYWICCRSAMPRSMVEHDDDARRADYVDSIRIDTIDAVAGPIGLRAVNRSIGSARNIRFRDGRRPRRLPSANT